ncbi:beta-phosphoglucomutase [Mycoplasma anatis]|nr:beta-phosphoglucomutase [Mycoplasmopsis anatis]
MGIYDKFDFIVNPADIKKGKPAPDIFIAAAKGLKLQPNECIGIEDSVEGLNSIVSAKIFSVAITNNSNEDFSKADVQLSFTNLLDFNNIKKLFQSSKGTN